MATISTISNHAAESVFQPDVPEHKSELPLAGLNFDDRTGSFSDSLLGPLYQPPSKRASSISPQPSDVADKKNKTESGASKESRLPFLSIKKRRSGFFDKHKANVQIETNLLRSASINSTHIKPSPSTSSNLFRSALISPLLKPKTASFSSSSFSSSSSPKLNSLQRKLSRHSSRSTPSRSNSSATNSAATSATSSPVLELPPVQINAHYQDLTKLFDDPYANMITETEDENIHNDFEAYEPSVPAPVPVRNPHKIDTNVGSHAFRRTGGLAPIKSIGSEDALSTMDLPDYSYYTTSFHENEDYEKDASSIQQSPVITQSFNHPASNPTQKPAPAAHSGPIQPPVAANSQTSPTTSPIMKQSGSFSLYSSSRSPPSRYEPVTNASHSNLNNYTSSNQPRNSISAVAKVKSMLPSFSSYRSLNKITTSTDSHNFHKAGERSPLQQSNSSLFSFEDHTTSPSALNSSFNLLRKPSHPSNNGHFDPRENESSQASDLPFSNQKPTPHFHEIDLGPTYKAKITPVKHSNSFQKNVPRSASTNTSPNTASKNNFTSNYTGGMRKSSSERDQLISQEANIESESLDFVPNLRPPIDPVGSRLRTIGVSSSANLMMTKSQYEQYKKEMMTKKEKKKAREEGRLSTIKPVKEEEEEEEDDEDDDDEDDEEEDEETEGRRIKHLEEEEERKKQNIRMRLRQDAHLAVYRQKMTKVTGSQLGLNTVSNLSSSNLLAGQSNNNSADSDDEYDDVPLGILKAHGFPASARLKTAQSQPNLSAFTSSNADLTASGTPDVMTDLVAPGGNKALRPLGDSQSVCSFESPFISNTSAPEEGFLAMRNPGNLSAVFGHSVPMNRGLIGEIAKEEEAKLRRKSVMNNLARDRTNTLMDQVDGASAFNPANESSSSGKGNGEIQIQISQMMQMQNQILQQMQFQQHQQAHQSLPVNSSMAHFGFTNSMIFPSAGSQFPPKNWSSFDVLGAGGPMMRTAPGAPSVRSYSPSINGSISSGNDQPKGTKQNPLHQHQLQQPHYHSYSTTSFKFPNNRGNNNTNSVYQPIQPPVQAQQYHAQQAMQAQQQLQKSKQRNSSYDNLPAARPFTMLENNSNNYTYHNNSYYNNNYDNDDDDDDEAGWKELENKRRSLKDMWRATPSPAIVS